MKIALNLYTQRACVEISHDGELLVYAINAFSTTTLDRDFDIFVQVNDYWATLNRAKNREIFLVFKELRYAFDDLDISLDRNKLTRKLKELVSKLYLLHPYEVMKEWVIFKSDINIPTYLSTDYVKDTSKTTTKEQTYLRSDYIELVTYSLMLRLMIPIWGEFINKTRASAGKDFKEYYAYLLLSDTELFKCVAANKLLQYIQANAPPETPAGVIISGVSSEDYFLLSLSRVVIRRVCIGDIRGVDNNSSELNKLLFNSIVHTFANDKQNFANVGIVKDKILDFSSGDDDDANGSRFEAYKTRQEITIGDKEFLIHGMRDIPATVLSICPDINMDMVYTALGSAKELENAPLNDAQVALAKWVFKAVISPRAFVYFSKGIVVQALAATQCILWHWGYRELAMLVTAKAVLNREGRSVKITNTDIKKQLPELNALYPYHKKVSRVQNTKLGDQALTAITEITEIFTNHDWVTTIDTTLLRQLQGDGVNGAYTRLFSAPENIKIKLISLVIDHISKLNRLHPLTILN